jgi:hypothetical protein
MTIVVFDGAPATAEHTDGGIQTWVGGLAVIRGEAVS